MIGKEIKRLRTERGLYQSDLADALSVSQSAVASWESGTRQPGLDIVIQIAQYFGVTTDEILGYDRGDNDRELWEFREQVRRDPERRELFHKARYADIEEVRQAVAVLDALKKTKGGD